MEEQSPVNNWVTCITHCNGKADRLVALLPGTPDGHRLSADVGCSGTLVSRLPLELAQAPLVCSPLSWDPFTLSKGAVASAEHMAPARRCLSVF